MKKYILRAPETDRKAVNVPTLLTDLDDYADTLCSGRGESDPYDAITNGAPADVNLDTFTSLVNVTGGADTLTVGNEGLFLITAQLAWLIGGTIPGPTPRAQYTLRSSGVRVNATGGIGSLTNAPTDDGIDSGTFITRLVAGDAVSIYATNDDAASEGRCTGVLTLAKIAP